jgi:hypothetical protein
VNTYALNRTIDWGQPRSLIAGLKFAEVSEGVGEPYRVVADLPILRPWGLTVLPLGQDVVASTTPEPCLHYGLVFAVVQHRRRHNPVQLGEFFDEALALDNYRFEISREYDFSLSGSKVCG